MTSMVMKGLKEKGLMAPVVSKIFFPNLEMYLEIFLAVEVEDNGKEPDQIYASIFASHFMKPLLVPKRK